MIDPEIALLTLKEISNSLSKKTQLQIEECKQEIKKVVESNHEYGKIALAIISFEYISKK